MSFATEQIERIETLLAENPGVNSVVVGNPVLRWMAGNVSLETDAADNLKPSKKKSRERIDGIVALERATACTSRPEMACRSRLGTSWAEHGANLSSTRSQLLAEVATARVSQVLPGVGAFAANARSCNKVDARRSRSASDIWE